MITATFGKKKFFFLTSLYFFPLNTEKMLAWYHGKGNLCFLTENELWRQFCQEK